MNSKKLSLNDFDEIGISELLKIKGGTQDPDPRINNCNQCDSRRCNGAAHTSISDAIGGAWDAVSSAGGAAVGGFTSYVFRTPWGVAGTGAVGYYNNVDQQYAEYNDGFSTQGCGEGSGVVSAPSRARILSTGSIK